MHLPLRRVVLYHDQYAHNDPPSMVDMYMRSAVKVPYCRFLIKQRRKSRKREGVIESVVACVW
jgi:hypothetical protein